MLQKVLKIGNSLGVTLPREFVVKNKIKDGAEISVVHSNGTITFSPKIPKSTEYEVMEDNELFGLIKDVESRYGDMLDELAEL